MSKPRVYGVPYGFNGHFEWEWECQQHDERFSAENWQDTYESVLGHVCMHHPAPECTHELGWFTSSNPGDHRCFSCGAQLPALENCS